MRILLGASGTAVGCGGIIWFYVLAHKFGHIFGDAFVALGVVPTLVGLVAAVVGVMAGAAGLSRRDRPIAVMTAGHASTLGLAAVVIVWAVASVDSALGLLLLPYAVMLGQIVTACGIVPVAARRVGGAGPVGRAGRVGKAGRRAS